MAVWDNALVSSEFRRLRDKEIPYVQFYFLLSGSENFHQKTQAYTHTYKRKKEKWIKKSKDGKVLKLGRSNRRYT